MGRAETAEPVVTLRRLGLVPALAGVALLGTSANAIAAPVRVRAVLDQDTVEFGDPVTATVTVVLDRDSDVSVLEDLAPLTQLGPTQVTKATRRGLHTITYTTRASCLDQRCISTAGGKRIALRPVVVQIAPNTKRTEVWPVLSVRARVSRADTAKARPPMRHDTTTPAVTYRLGPAGLARGLEAAAVVLAAAGLLLAGWAAAAVRRRRRVAAPLSGLGRALALAREAERRPTPDRRRALGLIARLLGARDPRLAGEADDLAWSAPAPTSDALAELVTQVEREVDGA
jgi:hypothetical protein